MMKSVREGGKCLIIYQYGVSGLLSLRNSHSHL